MVRSFGILCILAAGLMVGLGSASALGLPVSPLQLTGETQPVSFSRPPVSVRLYRLGTLRPPMSTLKRVGARVFAAFGFADKPRP